MDQGGSGGPTIASKAAIQQLEEQLTALRDETLGQLALLQTSPARGSGSPTRSTTSALGRASEAAGSHSGRAPRLSCARPRAWEASWRVWA